MLFSSMIFLWIFLPSIIILYYACNDRLKNYLLLFASLIFYAWGEPKYIVLMLVSIYINYLFGLLLDKSNKLEIDKFLLVLCVALNLLILVYFKYFNFLVESINTIVGGELSTKNIILPIGISFYTFQALSYVVDVYRGKHSGTGVEVQRKFSNLALYVSFFPQLIAGPIIKYKDVQDQIENRVVSGQKFAYGLRRFVYGLGKKVLISNILALTADKVFDIPISEINTFIAWVGILCYTLQIYYDFSGYSDMAIGLGKIFGFDFVENFNYPYIATSIQDFWRRWHISLSTWFREYLYIPLGGNRKGNFRTYVNLLIVFFATGIWHGASWNFVIWGIFHGFFLIIERVKLGEILKKNRIKVLNNLYTLTVVLVGWVFFRTETVVEALNYIIKLFIFDFSGGMIETFRYVDTEVILALTMGILFSGLLQQRIGGLRNYLYSEDKTYMCELITLPILLGVCILQLTSGAYNPFIYFRF